MSRRLNELRQHSRNSCITMECVQAPLSCKVTSHTHRVVSTNILFSPPERACMCASIFSNRRAHTVVCVSNAMCQGSIMLRIQSDGPQCFAQSSAECLYPALGWGGGHVLTSLCARVSALCGISVLLPST